MPQSDICSRAQKHFSTDHSELPLDSPVGFKHLSLQMAPLNYYGFLFASSSPVPPRTTSEGKETVGVTRMITNLQLKAKGDVDNMRSQVFPPGPS